MTEIYLAISVYWMFEVSQEGLKLNVRFVDSGNLLAWNIITLWSIQKPY